MIDSHAHLYLEQFDEDRESVIRRAQEAGVRSIINIGIDVETSSSAIDMARDREGFFASAGIHPQSPVEDLEGALAGIREL
ncbi:MAG: TatD family hydrolase, partial [Planctomycetota bacterium]